MHDERTPGKAAQGCTHPLAGSLKSIGTAVLPSSTVRILLV